MKLTSAQAKWFLALYHKGTGISNKTLYKHLPDLFPGGK